MKIKLTNVFVNDQDEAVAFYTDVLGFIKKQIFQSDNTNDWQSSLLRSPKGLSSSWN